MTLVTDEMIEASLNSAHGAVTYDNLKPSDPNYPFPEGGFWGEFLNRLMDRCDTKTGLDEALEEGTTGESTTQTTL